MPFQGNLFLCILRAGHGKTRLGVSFFDIFQIQEVHFGTFEVHFGTFEVHFGSFAVHFGSLLVISRPSFFEEMGFVTP